MMPRGVEVLSRSCTRSASAHPPPPRSHRRPTTSRRPCCRSSPSGNSSVGPIVALISMPHTTASPRPAFHIRSPDRSAPRSPRNSIALEAARSVGHTKSGAHRTPPRAKLAEAQQPDQFVPHSRRDLAFPSAPFPSISPGRLPSTGRGQPETAQLRRTASSRAQVGGAVPSGATPRAQSGTTTLSWP